MKRILMGALTLASLSAFANCSVEKAKVIAGNLIEEEFNNGPVITMQKPRMVVSDEGSYYKMILATNVKVSSGQIKMLLADMTVDKNSCMADYQFVGMTDSLARNM